MKAKIKSTEELVHVLKYYTTSNGINPDDLTHKVSVLFEDGNMKEVSPSEIQLMGCNEEFVLMCNYSGQQKKCGIRYVLFGFGYCFKTKTKLT